MTACPSQNLKYDLSVLTIRGKEKRLLVPPARDRGLQASQDP